MKKLQFIGVIAFSFFAFNSFATSSEPKESVSNTEKAKSTVENKNDAEADIKAIGKGNYKGRKQIPGVGLEIDCGVLWWHTCWTLYFDGDLVLENGEILGSDVGGYNTIEFVEIDEVQGNEVNTQTIFKP